MPSSHRRYAEWTPDRFRRWAGKIGPNTEGLISAVLASRPHPEQGFRTCLGILRSYRGLDPVRVEAVSARAVELGSSIARASPPSSPANPTPLPPRTAIPPRSSTTPICVVPATTIERISHGRRRAFQERTSPSRGRARLAANGSRLRHRFVVPFCREPVTREFVCEFMKTLDRSRKSINGQLRAGQGDHPGFCIKRGRSILSFLNPLISYVIVQMLDEVTRLTDRVLQPIEVAFSKGDPKHLGADSDQSVSYPQALK